jgi:hypothetical protein
MLTSNGGRLKDLAADFWELLVSRSILVPTYRPHRVPVEYAQLLCRLFLGIPINGIL